jgi:hypothetical protein
MARPHRPEGASARSVRLALPAIGSPPTPRLKPPTPTPTPPCVSKPQAGSLIVERLRTYRQPVFVYIPAGAELR